MGKASGTTRNSARKWLFLFAASAVGALTVGLPTPSVAAPSLAAPSVAAGSAGALWYPARQVLNPERVPISINVISCSALGDCAAAGTEDEIVSGEYEYQGFVIEQRGGIWGGVELIPGLAALNVDGEASVTALSCASPGNCAVGGSYEDAKFVSQAFVASERGGTWAKAAPVRGLAGINTGGASVTSVSCGAAGSCVAVGYYSGSSGPTPFLVAEVRGHWGAATKIPGPRGTLVLDVPAISCTGPGDCTLVGDWEQGALVYQSFATQERSGTWSTAAFPAPAAAYSAVDALSCASPGNCLAGGTYASGSGIAEQAAVWRESNGAWSGADVLSSVSALSAGGGGITQVSCASPGSCSAAGSYYTNDTVYSQMPFLIDETAGVWGKAQPIPGLTALGVTENNSPAVTSLSCGSPGDCTLGGTYYEQNDSGDPVFIADETGGAWGKARKVGATRDASPDDGFVAVSCTADGYCGAAGTDGITYYGAEINGTWVASKAVPLPTATSLRLSAAKVRYGQEQAERLTVTVATRRAGTPTGTVTVKAGSATICVITLKSGAGRCTLGAKRLAPGSYPVVARFGGGVGFVGSASAKATLTVAK